MQPTNWTPGIVVLVIGIAAAVLVLLLSRKKPAPSVVTAAKDPKLADLEQRVQLLVEQLRALDAEKHQLGPRYDEERSRLEREAAEALRARDLLLAKLGSAAGSHAPAGAATSSPSATTAASASASATAAAQPAPAGFWKQHPELKGALWGAGVVAAFVLVAIMLTQQQQDRGDGGMTGRAPPNDGQAQGQVPQEPPLDEDPHYKAMLQRVRSNPQDTEAAAFVAHQLIRVQRFDEADKHTKQALAADPFHLESRIHAAVLQATQGHFRPALDELSHLSRTYPEAHEALLFRGALAMQVGDSQLALESFELFQREAPAEEQMPQLDQAVQMLRARLAGRP